MNRSINTPVRHLGLLKKPLGIMALFLSLAGCASSKPGEAVLLQVIATSPSRNAVQVPLTTPIALTFSHDIRADKLELEVRHGINGRYLNGNVTYDHGARTVTFHPGAGLETGRTYQVKVKKTVTDLAGRPLSEDYLFIFSTGETVDQVAPLLSSRTPAPDTVGVDLDAAIQMSFSESIAPGTPELAFSLSELGRGTPVEGVLTYSSDNKAVVFDPATWLRPDTNYRAKLTTALEDLAGNALPAGVSWFFTTRSSSDTTAPTTSVWPPEGYYDAARMPVTVTLSADEEAVISYTRRHTPFHGILNTSGSQGESPLELLLSADGAYELIFHSRDRLGNTEGTRFAHYVLDSAAPVSTVHPAGENHVESFKLTFTLEDNAKGHDGIELPKVYFVMETTAASQQGQPCVKVSPAGLPDICSDPAQGGASICEYAEGQQKQVPPNLINEEMDFRICFRGRDRAGNWEGALRSKRLHLDLGRPCSKPSLAGGYYNSVQHVDISAFKDAGCSVPEDRSSISRILCKLVPGETSYSECQSGRTLAVLEPYVNYTLYHRALRDYGGGISVLENERQANYLIDARRPVIGITPVEERHGDTVVATLSCGSEPGWVQVYHTTDGSEPARDAAGNPVAPTKRWICNQAGQHQLTLIAQPGAEMTHTLRLFALDQAGNRFPESGFEERRYVIDKLEPHTLMEESQPPELVLPQGERAYRAAFSIQLQASEPGRLYHAMPRQGQSWDYVYLEKIEAAPALALTLDGQGLYDLYYYARDLVGNEEAHGTRRGTYILDSEAPQTTVVPAAGSYSEAVKVLMSAADNVLNPPAYPLEVYYLVQRDPGEAPSCPAGGRAVPGAQIYDAAAQPLLGSQDEQHHYRLCYWAVDRIDNVEQDSGGAGARHVDYFIDLKKPETAVSESGPAMDLPGGKRGFSQTFTVTLTASEPGKLCTSVDDPNINNFTCVVNHGGAPARALTFTEHGQSVLYYYAEDRMGHREAGFPRSVTYVLDRSGPSPITNLHHLEKSRAIFCWEGVGDDQNMGEPWFGEPVQRYEFRMSDGPISDETAWANALQVTPAPSPGSRGERHCLNVPHMRIKTKKYFAVRAFDKLGNRSSLPLSGLHQTGHIFEFQTAQIGNFRNFGKQIAALGDIGGDARQWEGQTLALADFAVSSYSPTYFGLINLYRGLENPDQINSRLSNSDSIDQGDNKLGSSLASGDFNGDGMKDLFAGTSYEDGTREVLLYLLTGTSSFNDYPDPPSQRFSCANGNALDAGDVDGDGYADLLIAGESKACIFWGNDSLSSTSLKEIYFNSLTSVAFLGNIDHKYEGSKATNDVAIIDSDLEFHSATDRIMIYTNIRKNETPFIAITLQYSQTCATPPSCAIKNSFYPKDILPLGDFNGDGIDDFAVLWFENRPVAGDVHSVRIHHGSADGSWQDASRHASHTYRPQLLAAGDLDGDGRAELLLYLNNQVEHRFIIYWGEDGAGALSTPTVHAFPINEYGYTLPSLRFLGDINGDGYGDFGWSFLDYDDRGVVYLYY